MRPKIRHPPSPKATPELHAFQKSPLLSAPCALAQPLLSSRHGARRRHIEETRTMTPARQGMLLATLLTVTAVSAAAYGQGAGFMWDASQLPETKGTVKQYTLTPRGDVDGLILNDGTEVKLPPHLTG